MILIAEDDPIVSAYLKAHLKIKGYEALLAPNGLDAWSILEKQHKSIELLITDVAMQGVDGIMLVERMRNNAHMSNIPAIFISGTANEENVRKVAAFGKTHYVVKPVSMAVLLPKIIEVMPFSLPVLRDREQIIREFHLDAGSYKKLAAEYARQIEQSIQNVRGGLANYTIFKEIRALVALQEGADLLGAMKFKETLRKIGALEDVDVELILADMHALLDALHKAA